MQNLSLLFTKDGLQWQISEAETIIAEEARFVTEDTPLNFIEEELDKILQKNTWNEVKIFSALNHFSLMPESFTNHDMGQQIISYNADVDKQNEELMLSINQKYGVQFYYTFPKKFYQKIKALGIPTHFDFTGEKMLNLININKEKEIHINLYHQQVEFFVMEGGKVVLYNNLDATSDVDFLYFIMFSLNKIDFGVADTHFYIYGEITENETFISELEKFAPNIYIVSENFRGKHFILNHYNS